MSSAGKLKTAKKMSSTAFRLVETAVSSHPSIVLKDTLTKLALHFHLAVAVPGSNPAPKTPGGSFEDTEFQYEPKLNEERDRELLDLLPDYLTEEICFPRSNAAKFYARVVDCLTKKVEIVEEEESEVVTQVQED
jgi:hypothetical protein